MSMKMVCNRCNKVKEDGESFHHINYRLPCQGKTYDDSDYDLCPGCSKKFEKFMKGCEVEEEDDREEHAKFDDYLLKRKNHCGTCANQWITTKCPRAKETPGTISCENDSECCDEWTPEVEPSIDKEESDLCVKSHKVTCPTTGETVTVPDSEPWVCAGTGRIHRKRRKDCSNCRYSAGSDESGLNYGPCIGDKTFHTPHGCDLWERRLIANEQSSET